jgi:ribosome-binding factor A
MTTIRQGRVAELLYEELRILIGNELDDPKLSLIEVTHVEVSRDLRSAKVHVHHAQEEVTRAEVIKRLQRANPYLRAQIALRCGLRLAPELVFHYDDTPTTAARVDELLRQIAHERTTNQNSGQTSASI